MKQIVFLSILVLFCALLSRAQNLIPNPSFEDTLRRTTPAYLPTHWITPTLGSPDYFTPFNPITPYVIRAPSNFWGYQVAKSGVAYMGIVINRFYLFGSNSKMFREYMQVELNNTLVQDTIYCLQLFVSLADSMTHASRNQLGVYFSNTAISSNNRNPLPYFPQIIVSPNQYISDKQNWLQFDFQYKSVLGGERFITIGNFNDTTMIDTLGVAGAGLDIANNGANYFGTYYYIDDVYLGHCDSLPNPIVGLEVFRKQKQKVLLYPNPANNLVKLDFENNGEERVVFELYDVIGKLHFQEELKQGNVHEFNVDRLNSGLYFYRLLQDDAIFHSGKLVKN